MVVLLFHRRKPVFTVNSLHLLCFQSLRVEKLSYHKSLLCFEDWNHTQATLHWWHKDISLIIVIKCAENHKKKMTYCLTQLQTLLADPVLWTETMFLCFVFSSPFKSFGPQGEYQFLKWIKIKKQSNTDKMSEQSERNNGDQLSLSRLFHWPPRLRCPGMESQQTTIKLCRAMLICLLLASVWPRPVDDYSSLAPTQKLIMKDKQSSACQLPTRISPHMKSLPQSTEPQALGLVSCQTSNMELTCCISLDICLTKTVLFPTYEEEEGETIEEEDEGEVEDTCLWWRLQFSALTPLQESPLAALSPALLSVWLRRLLAGVWRAAVGLRGDSGMPPQVLKENSQH